MNSVDSREWTISYLGDLVKIAIGGTPSRTNPNYWDLEKKSNNIWVSIKDLNRSVIADSAEYITDSGIQNSNVKLVPKDTVLMSFKLTVGKVAKAGRDLYTNEAIAAFVPLSNETITNNFLYYGLQSWNLVGEVDQAIKGVTLNKEKLSRIECLVPPLKEQGRIAEILTSVDEVIENTQSQINKLEDLKKATMNELLTKGIGHTEFKDTEIGRIPKDWNVCAVHEVAKVFSGGTPDRGIASNYDGTIPWVKSGELRWTNSLRQVHGKDN